MEHWRIIWMLSDFLIIAEPHGMGDRARLLCLLVTCTLQINCELGRLAVSRREWSIVTVTPRTATKGE